jgi:hypothetical protein
MQCDCSEALLFFSSPALYFNTRLNCEPAWSPCVKHDEFRSTPCGLRSRKARTVCLYSSPTHIHTRRSKELWSFWNIILPKGPHAVFSFTISLKHAGIRAKLDYKRSPSFYGRNEVRLLFKEDPTPKHNAIKASELRGGAAACTYEHRGCQLHVQMAALLGKEPPTPTGQKDR